MNMMFHKHRHNVLESVKTDVKDIVDQLLNLVNDNTIAIDDLCRIATSIGKSQSAQLQKLSVDMIKIYSNLDEIKQCDPLQFIETCNPVLYSFVTAITCTEEMTQRKVIKLVSVIENIFRLRHGNFIGPLNFSVNLMIYLLTGSEEASR